MPKPMLKVIIAYPWMLRTAVGLDIQEISKYLVNQVDLTLALASSDISRSKSFNSLEILPLPTFPTIRFYLNLVNHIYRNKYDIVQLHDCPYLFLTTLLPNELIHRTIVSPHFMTELSLRLHFQPLTHVVHDIITALDIQYRLVAKHAVFIAISEYMKNVIEQRWKARRIELIPNPIDTNMFKPLNVTFSINSFPKLLYVGALRPVKGVDTLILTMKYLIKKYPKSKLFIVGGGNIAKYVKLSRTLGVMDNIIFVGRLSLQELVYMYNTCDIFITASHWESFCRPIVEAMSCGKPVVCRDAYACSEHIRNSGAAVGFKSDEPDEIIWAIEKVLENYNQMHENARRYALKFESSKIAEKWLQLYKLLAGV